MSYYKNLTDEQLSEKRRELTAGIRLLSESLEDKKECLHHIDNEIYQRMKPK